MVTAHPCLHSTEAYIIITRLLCVCVKEIPSGAIQILILGLHFHYKVFFESLAQLHSIDYLLVLFLKCSASYCMYKLRC